MKNMEIKRIMSNDKSAGKTIADAINNLNFGESIEINLSELIRKEVKKFELENLDKEEKLKAEILKKLSDAQKLLSDVYHYAIDNKLSDVESQMSCADQCIIDSMNSLESK